MKGARFFERFEFLDLMHFSSVLLFFHRIRRLLFPILLYEILARCQAH